jgi:N-acetylneuraminic acid mutarotase
MRAWLLLALAACGGGGGDPDVDAGYAGPWRSAAPVRGGATQETAAVALDGEIHVIGGFGVSAEIVRVYDTATGEWSDGPALPEAIHHANAVVVDDTIYVLGFLTGVAFTPHGEVYAFTPGVDDAWRPRATMPAGDERGASIAGVVDGAVVVAGGLRGGAVADVSIYDPVDDAWVDGPPLPAPRDHACGAAIDGVLLVAGGRQGDIGSTADTLFALEDGAWVERAAMPTARGGAGCGVVDGRLIVVGGEGNPDDPSGVFPQVEAYDPAADAWTALPDMPTPRHGMGAAGWDGSLYVPGGATTQGFGAVDVHEILTPDRALLPAPCVYERSYPCWPPRRWRPAPWGPATSRASDPRRTRRRSRSRSSGPSAPRWRPSRSARR